MQNKNTQRIIMIVFLTTILTLIFYFCITPAFHLLQKNIETFTTKTASYSDYSSYTTPLDENVIEDICEKLKIKETSNNCKPDTLVYAPDFFNEIKYYFENLPSREKTFMNVDTILGKYMIECEDPHPNGNYRCQYDIRGDKAYPLFFWFDKNNYYFDIVIRTGGS